MNYTEPRTVDFAGDRAEEGPDFGMSGSNPLSPFTKTFLPGNSSKAASELTSKRAGDFGDWYKKNNVWINGLGAGTAAGGFTTLVHRLLTEPENRSWRRDLAYGIPTGMITGAVASGGTAVNNMFRGNGGPTSNPLVEFFRQGSDLVRMFKDPKESAKLDEAWANIVKNGKFSKAMHDNFIQWYRSASTTERKIVDSLINMLHGFSARMDAQGIATAREIMKAVEDAKADEAKERESNPAPKLPKEKKIETDPNARIAAKYTSAYSAHGLPLPKNIPKYDENNKVTPEYLAALREGYNRDAPRIDGFTSTFTKAGDFLSSLLNPVKKTTNSVLTSQGERLSKWEADSIARKERRRQSLAKNK